MAFIRTGLKEPYDFETITVSSSAKTLTASKLSPSGEPPPAAALLSLETAAIRYRLDGVAPTSSVGHLLASGDVLLLESITALRGLRAIADTETEGVLSVTYLR